jgi:hypothetical protein
VEIKNNHTVGVNTKERLVFCNTLGVIPFTDIKKKESVESHILVMKRFSVSNVLAVYVAVCM